MRAKKRQRVEEPTGRGKVFRGDDLIADVLYSLHVDQELIVSRSSAGITHVPGHRMISGSIQVTDGERHLMTGDVYNLKLEDGREFTFFARRGNPISGQYQISPAPGNTFEPKG